MEGRTPELSDNPFTRQNPVSKCGVAADNEMYKIIGVTLGYCISGSNMLSDYQYVSSSLCQDGRGGYSRGYFIMDVYEITNEPVFRDSVNGILPETTTLESEEEATEETEIEGSADSQGGSGADAGAVCSMVSIVLAMILASITFF